MTLTEWALIVCVLIPGFAFSALLCLAAWRKYAMRREFQEWLKMLQGPR
jgi:hypothetical protein